MSLQVEDHHRRGRSRSPGRRSRSRSRTPALIVDTDPASPYPSQPYYDVDAYNATTTTTTSTNRPYDPYYDDDRQYRQSSTTSYQNPLSPPITVDDYNYRRDSPRHHHHSSDSDGRERDRTGLVDAFLPQKYAKKLEASDAYNFMTSPLSERSRERSRDRRREKKEKLEEDLAYGKLPASPGGGGLTSPTYGDYGLGKGSSSFASAGGGGYDYDKTDERTTSSSYAYNPRYSSDALGASNGHHGGSGRSRSRSPAPRHSHRDSADTLDVRHLHGSSGRSRSKSPAPRHHDRDKKDKREKSHSHRDSLTVDPRGSSASIVTVEPGEAPRKSAMKRSSSPLPPVNKMASLSVNTAFNAGNLSASAAPASPLLESYHGTYQSMSPMPSPLLLPSQYGFDAQPLDLSPINSDDERAGGGKRRSRRARFTDPQDDAQRIADALRGSKAPKTEPLVEILPGLTHEQVMDLRAEYKRLIKTGPEKKGVNVAKHIRVRLKDEEPSLMKACYATALGKWESEAYWSSFWYQGDKTRRELLIESLMGRTNDEIREIKESFNDKTYDNSLVKCMKHELKEDKFKKAVLMVLDERRMEDVDRYGRRLPLDDDLVRDDVHDLRQAVKADKGGESAMISIVVNRSDEHLRAILRVYTDEYRSNFARDALRKSGNLVVSFSSPLRVREMARETNE